MMQQSSIPKPPTIQPRPLHNELASVVALARHYLMAADYGKTDLVIPSATAALLLNTLIQMAEGKSAQTTPWVANHVASIAQRINTPPRSE